MAEAVDPADRLVVDCPDCGGLGSKIRVCDCTAGDGRAVVDETEMISDGSGASFDDCRRCGGAGSLAYECLTCGGACRVRAQIVLTVINVDTGATASATVIPGAVDPVPDVDGAHVLPLRPLVDDLAERCGVGWIEPAAGDTEPLGTSPVRLDGWSADLPADRRFAIEAAGIAFRQGLGRHRVLIGRNASPRPADGGEALDRLCALASALCVDITISRRPVTFDAPPPSRTWQVRLAFPGAPLPVGDPGAVETDLGALIGRLRPTDLVAGLRAQRHRDDDGPAPARWITPPADPATASTESIDSIARRLDDLCGENGAMAIWRDDAWHYTTVSPSGARDEHRVLRSGQIRTSSRTTWSLDDPPPAPSYWGDPVPERGCAQCETGQSWVTCRCTAGGIGFPDPMCSRCGGGGSTVSGGCGLCGQIGRIRDGFTVSVVDGDTVRHVPFVPDPSEPGTPLGTDPARGTTAYILPERYRLASVLAERGVRVDQVSSLSGKFLSTDLLNGVIVMTPDDGDRPVTRRFCEIHARNPAARLFAQVVPPRTESLAVTASIARDLGLDLSVYCLQGDGGDVLPASVGHRWSVRLTVPDARDEDHVVPLTERTLTAAIGNCVDWFDHTLNVLRHADPTEPLPAPQRVAASPLPVDAIESTLTLLATPAPDRRPTPVSIRIGADGVRFARHRLGISTELGDPIALAATVEEAITAARSALG